MTTARHEQSTELLRNLMVRGFSSLEQNARLRSTFRMGPLSGAVVSNSDTLHVALTRCLVPGGLGLDMTVGLLSGSRPPFESPPDWNLPHTDSRHLERLHIAGDNSLAALFNPDLRQWFIFDRTVRQGLLWTADENLIPSWEQGSPFKTLFNWFAAPFPCVMVHAGAVGTNAGGCLLVGQGGSGKSTTVAACFDLGMNVCGDDLILLEPETQGYRVWALYDALKFDPQSGVKLPGSFQSASYVMSASKRLVRYTDIRKSGFAHDMAIRAVVRCVIVNKPLSRMVAETPAAMLKAVAPPTVFLLRGFEELVIRKISQLVRTLPCYRLELGRDPSEAATHLKEWLVSEMPAFQARSRVP